MEGTEELKKPKRSKPSKRSGLKSGPATSYRPYMNSAVREYLLLHGKATNKAIGEHLGHSEMLISQWRSDYTAFDAAILEGKDGADTNVAASGYKLATGYDYTEEQVVKLSRFTKEGREEYLDKITITKHKPGNITAVQFWLANRHHNEWTRTDRIKVKIEETETALESDAPSPYLAMIERYNVHIEPPEIPGCPTYKAGESRKHHDRHDTTEQLIKPDPTTREGEETDS